MKNDAAQQSSHFALMLHIDDEDLDPFEYRLLGHYRRVCGMGDGECYEMTQTTAAKCKMSQQKVREARSVLQERGDITIERRDGGTSIVKVVTRMAENITRMTADRSITPVKNVRPVKNDKGAAIANLTGEGVK